MSRDDSALYTGATSASFTTTRTHEITEKRALQKQDRRDVQHRLQPAAEVILALIDKHKKSAMFVENVTGGIGLTDSEAGQVLRSQRQYYRFLVQFENEIKLKLKEVPDDKPKEAVDE